MEESLKKVTAARRAYSLHRRRYLELWEEHEIRFGEPSLAKRISDSYSKKKPAAKKDPTKADKPKVGKPKKEKKAKAEKPKKKKAKAEKPKETPPAEEESVSSSSE